MAPRWQQRLSELVDRLDVPGAVVGVSHRGERVILTAGVENMRGGHPVIPATAFQVGSISKVYTATLLAAVTDLDSELLQAPVSGLVPEAAWMDPRITVTHLLTHSSGLPGDCFADTGRGDDALAIYVAALEKLPPDHPGAPGERYSYCNSGYAVLGRLIEVLTGQSYEAALHEHVLKPLGVCSTTALPEQTLCSPHAMGHNRLADKALHVDDAWCFARASTALGGICAPAEELLAFAELHIAGGLAPGGRRVISEQAAATMRRRHLQTPPLGRPSARGLGWGIYDTDQGEIIGHDGETLGQIAKLRLIPEQQLALAVLTNGIPDGNTITRTFETEILGYAGTTVPQIKVVPLDHFDRDPYLGHYRNLEGPVEVTASERGLRVRAVQEAEGLSGEEDVTELVPIGGDAFVDASDERPTGAQRFGDPDAGGRCRSYYNGRVHWRVDGVDRGAAQTARR